VKLRFKVLVVVTIVFPLSSRNTYAAAGMAGRLALVTISLSSFYSSPLSLSPLGLATSFLT